MKLYYSPGACSLASHIVAREVGIAIELEKVEISSKRTQGEIDFLTINPKGNVPVARTGRREFSYGRSCNHAVPRGLEARTRSRSSQWDDGAVPSAGMAWFH